ncbi:MAG: baseplate wedge protein, partial [Minisyncoccia bacterium]
ILFALNVSSTEKTSGGNSVIQIAAVPKSNDILGLQDLYLQLDINNISINMVSDSVSSGESTAGSYYTISSSYKQNNLKRK